MNATHKRPDTAMDAPHCPTCRSHEVYLSNRNVRARYLSWLHPGRRLVHCHACGRYFWAGDVRQAASHFAGVRSSIGPDPSSAPSNSHIDLHCPSCGAVKTGLGRLWDDMWTLHRGHNKLYRCRKCNTVFAPPS